MNASDDFTCDCDLLHRSACRIQPFFKSHKGKDYCVLHYPGTDKLEPFRAALNQKIAEQDFNFQGVWFPEKADFTCARFPEKADFTCARFRAEANFSGASFNAKVDFTCARFRAEANFSDASFNAKANFTEVRFCAKANFYNAIFSAKADFYHARFRREAAFSYAIFSSEAYFNKAIFNAEADFSDAIYSADTYFNKAIFNAEADFHYATFKDFARFSGTKEKKAFGKQPRLNFQFTQFEKPERVSFHTLILRPSWFINIAPNKFEFTDVDWDFWLNKKYESWRKQENRLFSRLPFPLMSVITRMDWNIRLKEELKSACESDIHSPHRLLSISCRQLADNAEANHRYLEASDFRYNAFEAHRIERFGGFVPWRLDWWYWLASGYGESVGRAFLVFVTLLALFACGYMQVGFDQSCKTVTAAPPATVVANPVPPTAPDLLPKRLGWREAALYSFNVSILQKPEPKPKGLWSSFLVSLETVLGPAQAALLALAVRRRFMR